MPPPQKLASPHTHTRRPTHNNTQKHTPKKTLDWHWHWLAVDPAMDPAETPTTKFHKINGP